MRIYEFALDVERSGREFYKQMADRVRDPGIQRIFEMMAQEERRMLASMMELQQRAELKGVDDVEMFSSADNVYRQQRPEKLRALVHNDVEAYHLILDLVEEVCRVYEERAMQLDDPALREALADVLTRERDEYEELLLLHDFANAPNESLAWGEFSNLEEFPRFGNVEDTEKMLTH